MRKRAAIKGLCAFAVLGCLAACVSTGTNVTSAFTPPAACVQDNATGKYDSQILTIFPDPRPIGVVLQIANYGAISKGLYKADDALKVLESIKAMVAKGMTYGDLATYVATTLKDANTTAGIVIFTNTGMLDQFASTAVINDCDKALILAHLENQETLVKALVAAGK